MLFKQKKQLTDYFDVSVVVRYPEIERERELFAEAFMDNCKFLQRNGIEVILVTVDGIGKTETADLVERYPFINWKIVNCSGKDRPSWQAGIMTGISYAENALTFVMESGMLFLTDVVYRLRYLLDHYAEYYAVCGSEDGLIGGLMINSDVLRSVIREMEQENDLNGWCRRMAGLEGSARFGRLDVPEAAVAFLYQRETVVPPGVRPAKEQAYSFIYDWKDKTNKAGVGPFLTQFEMYWLCPACEMPDKEYGIIGLIPVRDEIKHLPDVLANMESYCDGIILLDDGSLDDSFEAAISTKLLLKVKKKRTEIFDDLTNRNLLLQLGHFFNAGWFFFMDADERFDPRYADLRAITRLDHVDTVGFKLVHIWDSPGSYRKDLPEGKNGLVNRYRMFRNKGYLQISSRNEVHFKCIPFKRNVHYSRILVLHYGLMEKNTRERKFRLYKSQDRDGKKQGFSYAYLLDETIDPGKVSEIRL